MKLSIKVFAALAMIVVNLLSVAPGRADPEDVCARIRNDDTVRPYDAKLRPGFVRAFHKLFPNAKGGQSEAMLRAQAGWRCMDGRLYACFTGANLPCVKLDRRRENAGAEAFCRATPGATDVPLFATGHESAFVWKCRGGQAFVAGDAYPLDARGFAAPLWAPLD